MFTVEQYRAKAKEYSNLARTANNPDDLSEFQKLERSYAELADNAQWAIDNYDILCTERIADTNELQVRLVEFVGNLPLVYLKSP
jgi:hypothetical protein